jgi:hypothetical protein
MEGAHRHRDDGTTIVALALAKDTVRRQPGSLQQALQVQAGCTAYYGAGSASARNDSVQWGGKGALGRGPRAEIGTAHGMASRPGALAGRLKLINDIIGQGHGVHEPRTQSLPVSVYSESESRARLGATSLCTA